MSIRKNRIILILIFIISLVFLFFSDILIDKNVDEETESLVTDDYNGLDIEDLDSYDIDLDLFPNKGLSIVDQRVEYINKEDVSLGDLYFHIYPNAFQDGSIEIRRVEVEGDSIDYSIEGGKDKTLHIDLEEELKSGEKTTVELEYRLELPPASGYGEEIFNFKNWYPIAAVYDEDGWNLDSAYSDISNYDVEIKTPVGYEIAASGHIWSESVFMNNKTWNIEARLMRDFAWTTSPSFDKIEKRVDDTLIKLYFLDGVSEEAKEKAIASAEEALTTFNRVFGQYPYSDLSLVQSDFSNLEELESLIVQQVADQWWYGVVGHDQMEEDSLGESLLSYSEYIYLEEVYSEDIADERYNENENILYSIREEFGKEVVYQILSEYYQEYRFKNPRTGDFMEIVDSRN